MKKFTIVAIGILIWDVLILNPNVAPADDRLSFNHDIRPILSDYCFACHGPDEHDRAADLRLDQSEAAIDYGAIVPGDPDASLLVERILSDDPDLVMPPAKDGKTLSEEQQATLVRWIKEGAEYQKHWAFEPVPKAVEIPPAENEWPRNPVDHFVAEKHRQQGLDHTQEADRSTWLRRVTFDLTGLPPTLDDLDAFLSDRSKDAYATVVNRLLSSPAYGERMANMWLDVARYADTFGYQNDVAMEVWPWRDWVIEAFNRNMPYDQFITEQIAGDLIPDASTQQRLATTFNRLHRQTNEGGSIAEEFRLTGIADRTTTAGTAFLGITLECCRCHDHKFDPIKQKEFYQLSAYFADIDEFGLYSHFTRAVPTPSLSLYTGDQKQQHADAIARVAATENEYLGSIETATKAWKKLSEKSQVDIQPDTLPVSPNPTYHNPLNGDTPGVVDQSTRCDGDKPIVCDDAPVFSRASPFTYSLWVNPATQQERMVVLHQSRAAEDSGFRGLELTIDEGHPQFSMIHFWPGNAVRVRATQPIATHQWTQLAVSHDGSGRAAGLRLYVNGQPSKVEIIRDKLTRDILHRKEWGDSDVGKIKLSLAARFRDIGFRDGQLDDLRVFDQQLSSLEILSTYETAINATTDNAEVKSGDNQINSPANVDLWLEHHLLRENKEVQKAHAALQEARREENKVFTSVRQIMTMSHYEQAPPTHVLQRGEYTNKGKQVSAATFALGGLKAEGGNRLALAQWMTHPDHPLTSRVMVNRMWHLFFGRGIAVTLEDFGSQGSPPSHPQLLDYLSREFINHNWDLHWLARQIVLSATYRQSSSVSNPQAYGIDPDNQWLARGPKHRLSAEQLRDSVLAASGLLVHKVGGPSVMPYQPAGLWKEAGTGKRYQPSSGGDLFRRSMYTFWKRTAPPPTMITFDATNRETCTARRELTTTPLQALVFLNDPQYIEASRVLAESLISHSKGLTSPRWQELFRRLISRAPTAKEQTIVQELYDEQLAYFQSNADKASEFVSVGTQPVASEANLADLAATTIVVQSLFAYDETIMLR